MFDSIKKSLFLLLLLIIFSILWSLIILLYLFLHNFLLLLLWVLFWWCYTIIFQLRFLNFFLNYSPLKLSFKNLYLLQLHHIFINILYPLMRLKKQFTKPLNPSLQFGYFTQLVINYITFLLWNHSSLIYLLWFV